MWLANFWWGIQCLAEHDSSGSLRAVWKWSLVRMFSYKKNNIVTNIPVVNLVKRRDIPQNNLSECIKTISPPSIIDLQDRGTWDPGVKHCLVLPIPDPGRSWAPWAINWMKRIKVKQVDNWIRLLVFCLMHICQATSIGCIAF